MQYVALVTDYDGTLAHDGVVDEPTMEALRRLRQSGRKSILVTGRELPDLEKVFPHLDLFDRVVVENGAVLFDHASREKRVLAERPPDAFIAELRKRNVNGLSVGDVIVATWHPHEAAVLESIRQIGLDLQVIFNKDAVMVLPAGVNKLTGLRHALAELRISRHNIAGVGDAENDHAFLNCCECSVAVSNALPAVKERADWVTDGARGAGVTELVERMVHDDLRSVPLSLEKHGILFGREGDRDVFIEADGRTVLLCGLSGGGKSTFVAGFLERLVAREFQVCLIDPEGDYEDVAGLLTLGNEEHSPSIDEILKVLDDPSSQLIVNLVGLKMQDRPSFFTNLFGKLQEKRVREGRPHWIIVDEAHHLMSAEWAPLPHEGGQTGSLLLVTVHPQHVSPAALRRVNVLTVIGKEPHNAAEEFARTVGIAAPPIPNDDLGTGEAAVWLGDSSRVIERMHWVPDKTERKRHRRKYAEGELEPERVFYFRGPDGKLNLRANNLTAFLQLAAGVDDDTWMYHLRRGDYSLWITTAIRDEELSGEIGRVEQDQSLSPKQSREAVAKAIEAKYAAPA